MSDNLKKARAAKAKHAARRAQEQDALARAYRRWLKQESAAYREMVTARRDGSDDKQLARATAAWKRTIKAMPALAPDEAFERTASR